MTIELSYRKGEEMENEDIIHDIWKKLPDLYELVPDERAEKMYNSTGWKKSVLKDNIDIKVIITINHESVERL